MSQKLNAMDEALQEFISEGNEILQRVSEGLQVIEKGGSTPDLLSAVYRDMHTLKGTAQLFGFQEIGRLAHMLEASLDPIRKKNLLISARLLECCFNSLDLFAKMLSAVQTTKSDQGFATESMRMITQLVDAASAQFSAEMDLSKDIMPILEFETTKKEFQTNTLAHAKPDTKSEKLSLAQPIAKSDILHTKSTADVITVEKSVHAESNVKPNLEVKSIAPTMQENKMDVPKNSSSSSSPSTTGNQDNNAANSIEATIRVQVSLLDNLMNIIGELVLVRNQFLQYRNKSEETQLVSLSKNLDVVTTQLQSEVMKTRMQPISNVVSKFQRVVRDLAKDLNKRIDMTLEGMETELDKTLLEAIKDPLTHLVRNSCDHGIEMPAERRAVGKPETGHLIIRAFHEGGHVVVEIADDGKGLDSKKLIAKAIENNLITAEKAQSMDEREVNNLIFMPGFSTAKSVTSVSGRGVGMDVVKTNIEKIGGSIVLNSVLGKGMTTSLKIPLTLAIVPALLVKAGVEKFAIPQVKLVELVHVEESTSEDKIEYLQGRPMYRLRGALLALVDLREITDQKNYSKDYKSVNIVVLNAEGEIFGLIVDDILDTADIVVKPLSAFLKNLSLFAGSTIMGDGSIAIILDVLGIAHFGNINTKKNHQHESALFGNGISNKKNLDAQEFLLFSLGTTSTHAVPLCLVQRLEEFKSKDIEFSGSQRVVRYRGHLLPILDLKQMLKYDDKSANALAKNSNHKNDTNDVVSVVVVQRSGRSYGVQIKEVLDIITVECNIDDSVCDRAGVLGNIVINNAVVVVVDVLGLIEHGTPQLGKSKVKVDVDGLVANKSNLEFIRKMNQEMKSKKIRVLYAEDVAFFRKHVMKVLIDAGFEVTVYEDGAKAFNALENSIDGQFNLIISDIEMPNMDGLGFAREVRKKDRYKDIPMIALTTKFKQSDIDEGIKAGFSAYMEKLDPEKLLNKVGEFFPEFKEQMRRADA